jgi:hypothetical protein
MIRVSLELAEIAAKSRPDGYMEELLAAGELEDGFVVLPDETYDRFLKRFSGKTRPCGVGCQLKKTLSSIGIEPTDDCPCEARAAIMDAWGPDVCLKSIATIVGWMREEAEIRGLLFNDIAAGQLVRLACWRARKNSRKVASERT